MKHCKQCDTTKPISDFYTNKGQVRWICKECYKANMREEYKKNPRSSKEYYQKNKEKCNAYSREYYRKNKKCCMK